MVGVQDMMECPQCKFEEARYEYQTRDGTQSLFCPRCGYSKYSLCCIDRKREKETGTKYYKKTKDGKFIGRVYEHKGYGGYSVSTQDGGITSLCRFTCDGKKRDKIVAGLKALRRQGLSMIYSLFSFLSTSINVTGTRKKTDIA